MPLQQTSGNSTTDAYGGGAAVAPVYIEDVMSTFLYTGNGTSQTITNGIDLAGKGGLVWCKSRSSAVPNYLQDSARSNFGQSLVSEETYAQFATSNISSVTSTGFNVSSNVNISGQTLASWTFRKQPKFFDVVTYTGNGISGRTVPHNLTVAPGFVIVKRTDASAGWACRERIATGYNLLLNSTVAGNDATTLNNGYIGACTSTTISLTTGAVDANNVNASGGTYVAYLFAHNAGGFGATGTDNVISCGSYTTNASAVGSATLGYEPQFLMVKRATGVGEWYIVDNMRGWGMTQAPILRPNSSGAEDVTGFGGSLIPTATGFEDNGAIAANSTMIYIAIRRGPMKVPTDGTKVFAPIARTGTGGAVSITGVGLTPDMTFRKRSGTSSFGDWPLQDRLRGPSANLFTNQTYDEAAAPTVQVTSFDMNGATYTDNAYTNTAGIPYINYFFKRAPGFFDEVCYTNPPSSPVDQTHSHNLGVVPTLVITKARSSAGGWIVLLDSSILGSVKYLYLNTTAAAASGLTYSATSTQYTTSFLGNYNETQVAYLFATCPGVSKVFSFTGNGTTQTINCGFAGGARFVLLKASSATGGWFTYDTARGMTVLTDPYLQLNTTAAEVATLGSVTTVTTGFAVNEAITTGVNTNGVTYIGLAIA